MFDQIEPAENPVTKSSVRSADALEKMLAEAEKDRQEQKRFNEEQKRFNALYIKLAIATIVVTALFGVCGTIINLAK